MQATLQTIDKLSAELQALLPMKPEYQQRLDKKMRLEFNYNSNHMEGNTLTYGETELLLIFDKTTGNHELREYEEMKAHDAAFQMIKEWAADAERPLTEAALKNLHALLLVRPFWKEAQTPDGQATRRLIEVGAYKKYPNSVRLQNGEMFHYASPEETPAQMGDLMQWFRDEEEKGELHPTALATLLHYKFVRIHPFDDGNGRISRFLMNYVLLKAGFPPVVIKSDDKKNYLFALNQADAGNLDAFVQYIATQAVWSLELAMTAAKGKEIEEGNDWEKELSLLKKEQTSRQQFTAELSNTIKNDVFYPLVQKLTDKLSGFDDFFVSKEMLFKVTNDYQRINSPADIKKFGLAFWDYKSIEDSIAFRLNYEGLKNSTTANGFMLDVKLFFKMYHYEIELGTGRVYIQKSYGQFPTQDVMNEAINTTAKGLLEFVKEHSPK